MIPKQYLNNLRLRKKAFGKERRLNLEKLILEKGTPFPKPIEYTDIDKGFENWANNLGISFEGKRLPIFKLYSNQRVGEYAQTWEHLDEVGNLLLNFLCITRENNPKHGENQGSSYNIPGNRKYPLCIVPKLEENGETSYEMYSIKQPFCVDFLYKLTIITNRYDLLNKMNESINNEFKSLECYITVNNHYMPMELANISDESEYSLDDRKYYSQTYEITLKAYIIRKEDMEVTQLPSRIIFSDSISTTKKRKTSVQIEDIEDYEEPFNCCNARQEEGERYKNKKVKLTINFPLCEYKTTFEIDESFEITDIETNNVYDFVMKINNEYVNFDNEIIIESGDELSFEIERNDNRNESTIELYGESTTDKYDATYDAELESDGEIIEEDLVKEV